MTKTAADHCSIWGPHFHPNDDIQKEFDKNRHFECIMTVSVSFGLALADPLAVPSSPQSLSSDHLDSAGECLHGVPRPAQLPTGQQGVGGWEGQDCGWCCWVWLAGNGRHCVACAPWTAVRDRRSKRESIN